MKKKPAKRTYSLMALLGLVLCFTITMAPLRAEAAKASTETRMQWSAIEAEIAREFSDGVALRDIINNNVRSGERIHEVVTACIKVGIDPSLVVYTALAEGYAAQTVVKAALKAGVSVNTLVNSATHAKLDEKSMYVGTVVEGAIRSGEDPSLLVYTAIIEGYSAQTVIQAALKAGASLDSVITSATHAGPPDKSASYRGEVVAGAIKAGEDPSRVVYTTISQGYPAQNVVTSALKAGAPVDAVVMAAAGAGADNKSIYVGAADAGASPNEVERALSKSKTAGASVFISAPLSVAALPSSDRTPAPAAFGWGGIVLSPMPVWALPTLRFESLKINPFLSISETFSDNILYTQNDKKSDAIAKVTPGVRVQLPFKAHVAELDYYSVIARYGTHSEEDITDHHVGGSVDLKSGDRLELLLSDNYDRGHEPRSSTPTGTNEVFHTNVAVASASYLFTDSVMVRLDYGKSTWRFITSNFRDREEDLLAGAVFYRVHPKASLFIEYGHRNIAYAEETDLDSTVGTMQAGLTWDFSSRTKGTLKAGFARKDFSSSAMTGGTVKVGSADVRHDFTSDTTVVLTAQRSMNEPDIPDSVYFISTGGYAELMQRFAGKWTAAVRGAYVHDLYFVRTDRTSLAGAGLRYRAKDWLEFALDYNQRQRQSDIPGYDYREQSSLITMTVSL